MTGSGHKLLRLGQAVIGLGILALGIVLLIAAQGPDPWGVFLLGLQRRMSLSLGYTALGGGLLLIGINYFWGGRKPGIATVMSMLLVAVFIEMFGLLVVYGRQFGAVERALLLAAGIGAMALGIAVYVRAELGEGPVEGLMFVISDKLNISVGRAKVLEDCLFVLGGVLLGWPLQVGTLVSALTVGPATQLFLTLADYFNRCRAD